ncbi:hypothetical protein HanHA300_Chr16g0617631 [Helianthus annuus]|nr:hypothetical protein HanHA300_Chr16g0617631 [Helianthus annuus]
MTHAPKKKTRDRVGSEQYTASGLHEHATSLGLWLMITNNFWSHRETCIVKRFTVREKE